jgi:small subunit ribosomal protein S20
MANTKSAKKALRSSAKKRAHNLSWKRKVLKSKNSFKEALSKKPKIERVVAENLLKQVKKIADKATSSGALHKNKSAKIKSSIDKIFSVWAK